ncbi:hypothetical protein Tco_1169231 [Tanacetum coccineum]
MLLNVDQLQKKLDKDEFQEDGSHDSLWLWVNKQFQEVSSSKDTLLQHLGNVKKSIAERTRHQRQYERRVNKRQMQTQEIGHGSDTDADDAVIRPIYEKIQWLTSVDSEPPHGLNVDNINIMHANKMLDVSAGTSINVQKEQSLDLSVEGHQAAEIVTMSNELDLLFGPLFNEYFNEENQVVLKSSAVTTTDASNKRQQQLD